MSFPIVYNTNYTIINPIVYDYHISELYDNLRTEDRTKVLSKDEFQKLYFSEYNSVVNKFETRICPISHENFQDNSICTLLECGHIMLKEYAEIWITTKSATCPVCRHPVKMNM